MDPRGWSAPTPGQYTCILQIYSKIFFSETTRPIKAKFYMKHQWEVGINVFINNPGNMTKMTTMPIYGKNPSKFFFSGTTGPISTKLGMKHWGLEYYNVFINYDLWMTLTYFTARSTKVTHAFEWGKLLKSHLKGKSCRKWANGPKVGNSEKKFGPPGVGLPPPRGNIHVYYKNIRRSSSLKPLGQSKPNFIGSIYGKWESMCL